MDRFLAMLILLGVLVVSSATFLYQDVQDVLDGAFSPIVIVHSTVFQEFGVDDPSSLCSGPDNMHLPIITCLYTVLVHGI
jgi:hypothetical protein